MRKLSSGGGWQAVRYSLKRGHEVGYVRMWRAMTSHNACKTCALGMGGQQGGMRNESGRFPEVCKKSFQAMAADMRGKIDPSFFSQYSIDELKGLSPRDLEMLGRLADPILADPGSTHYRVISWDEAAVRVSQALKETTPERTFFYSSGRSSNEAGFLMQLFARVYGTNHVNNCSFYCHQASGTGLSDSIGSSTATVSLEDVDECDLLFLIGGNPASNHPRLMTSMARLRERGGQIVVINPVKELGLQRFRVPSNPKSMLFGTEIASLYLQPKIGGDIAIMVGIAKWLFDNDRLDLAFIESSTLDFELLRALVEQTGWDEIESAAAVPRDQIEQAAQAYARSGKAIFSWTMGITHHVHGVENVQWIVNLALLRGMVGKPGAGLMPIRGHSNVQGLGTIGVTPAIAKAAMEGLERLGVKPPDFKGYDTLSCLEAADRGEIDFGLCLGGNLYGASPDAECSAKALSQIGTLAYMSTTLNTGHAHGLGRTTLVLPVRARDEEAQSTTQESMFSFVRLSDGGPERYQGPMSEVDVIVEVAERVLGPDSVLCWSKLRDHEEIRKLIALLIPKLAEIADIGKTKKEFHIPGRVLHDSKFPTATGRANFKAHPIPTEEELGPNQVRVMTVRSEGQFNTVVYEEEDIYRNQERRDVILLNPSDIASMGLRVDQRVDVVNETGAWNGVLVREFDIARGCGLMYYPEANVLMPKTHDPRSKTPAFKNVLVTITPR